MHIATISLVLMCSLLATTVSGDIQVQWSIIPPPNSSTVDLSNLGQAAAAQGATGIVNVIQSVDTQLTAEQCQPGTYSQRTSTTSPQQCIACPAGTFSAAVGASDPSTCVPCVTGAYSAARSSACTDCVADTFSVTRRAADSSVCLQCPPDATSPSRSSSVEMCICDQGNFLSDNIMKAFPYDAIPIDMSLSGIASIDVPHVTC